MMTTTEANSDWAMIEAQLPMDWRTLASEMGLIRERPAQLQTKVDDIGTILKLVFHQAGTSSSLRATAGRAAATGVLAMSWVALHKWFKKLGPYLATLLGRMVETAAFASEKWGGFDVIAGDATTVQRPASKGTTARVHYALRLADLTPRHIEVTDEHGGETARRFRAEPGELWLLDRGYANPLGVASIVERNAHIVVRYNRGTLPVYDARGNRIDVLSLLRNSHEREHAYQKRARVDVDGRLIEGRLCWLRLPKEKAAEARIRAERESVGLCDAATLVAAEYVVIFTSVLSELTAVQLLDLYRARWQVELDFKRSKSLRELDRLPNFLPETIHCWICAKLLLQLVATRIATPAIAFPPGEAGRRQFCILPAIAGPQKEPRRRRRGAVVRREAHVGRPLRGAIAGRAA
jgi:hypothetical protein